MILCDGMSPPPPLLALLLLLLSFCQLSGTSAAGGEVHCPLACSCRPVRQRVRPAPMEADCSGALKILPAQFQHHFVSLDASFNKLENISKDFFGDAGSLLSKINLSNNSISIVDKKAFAKLPELWIMNLTGNKIQNLSHDTFKANPKLWYLILRSNNINIDNHAIFLNAPQIEKLDLSYNNIRELRETTFSEMQNITYLRLHNNQFKRLHSSWFRPLEKLEHLYLEQNQLTHLDVDTFVHTPKLFELGLSRNKLIVPSDTPFLRLPNLEYLHLVGCDFGSLPPHMFELSPRVRMLWIGSNRLRSLPIAFFNYMESLVFLNACDNQLQCTCALREVWELCRYRNVVSFVSCAYGRTEAAEAAAEAAAGCAGRWDVLEDLTCNGTARPPTQLPAAAAEHAGDGAGAVAGAGAGEGEGEGTSVARMAAWAALGAMLLLCLALVSGLLFWKYRTRAASASGASRNFAYQDMMPLHVDREEST